MAGEKDLGELLKSMEPRLAAGEFVFCSVPKQRLGEAGKPLLTFLEDEGTTVVLERSEAEALGLEYGGVWAMLTLSVHSDLEAIGFLAVISGKLAEKGISVNVVSAYYHDHLFVPFERRKAALRALRELQDKG